MHAASFYDLFSLINFTLVVLSLILIYIKDLHFYQILFMYFTSEFKYMFKSCCKLPFVGNWPSSFLCCCLRILFLLYRLPFRHCFENISCKKVDEKKGWLIGILLPTCGLSTLEIFSILCTNNKTSPFLSPFILYLSLDFFF